MSIVGCASPTEIVDGRWPFNGNTGGQATSGTRRDLDGIWPYLDPAKPIPRQRIKRAAKKAHVPGDKIDETVRSLSAHLGWDITKGAAG